MDELKELLESLQQPNHTRESIDVEFIIDEASNHLTRRQAIVLRLILVNDGITQLRISKMLGYSFTTISLDVKKIRKIVKNIIKNK